MDQKFRFRKGRFQPTMLCESTETIDVPLEGRRENKEEVVELVKLNLGDDKPSDDSVLESALEGNTRSPEIDVLKNTPIPGQIPKEATLSSLKHTREVSYTHHKDSDSTLNKVCPLADSTSNESLSSGEGSADVTTKGADVSGSKAGQSSKDLSDSCRHDLTVRRKGNGEDILSNALRPSPIIFYMKFLRFVGIDTQPMDGMALTSIGKFCIFLLICFLSFMQSFDELKFSIVRKEYKGNQLRLVLTLAYLMNNFVFRSRLLYTIKTKRTSIESLALQTSLPSKSPTSKLMDFLPWFLFLSSMLMALLSPILDAMTHWGTDPKDILLFRSLDFARLLFDWNKYTNGTELYEKYGSVVTPVTLIMSVADTLLNYVGSFVQFAAYDILILIAICAYKRNLLATKLIENCNENTNHAHIWLEYDRARKTHVGLDKLIGQLLEFLHFENIFFGAYFAFEYLYSAHFYYTVIVDLMVVVKILIFYYYSNHASDLNDAFLQWIYETYRKRKVTDIPGYGKPNLTVVLHQLTNDPMGLGRQLFFINRSFLWRLGSLTSSVLASLISINERS